MTTSGEKRTVHCGEPSCRVGAPCVTHRCQAVYTVNRERCALRSDHRGAHMTTRKVTRHEHDYFGTNEPLPARSPEGGAT